VGGGWWRWGCRRSSPCPPSSCSISRSLEPRRMDVSPLSSRWSIYASTVLNSCEPVTNWAAVTGARSPRVVGIYSCAETAQARTTPSGKRNDGWRNATRSLSITFFLPIQYYTLAGLHFASVFFFWLWLHEWLCRWS
jgi:hypothetical protein